MITTQVIGSVGVSTSRQFIGAAFRNFNQQILKLFVNGEQGFFYDPNDLSTMFQDYAGTIPVTAVGPPVAIILDKSKELSLGFERVTNGNFSNGVTSWKGINGADEVVANGFLNFTSVSVANPNGYQNGVFEPNKSYKVSFRVANYASGHVYLVAYSSTPSETVSTVQVSTNGVYTTTIKSPPNATGVLGIRVGSVSTLSITDVSVKEVLGNHAYQTTSSARPILQDAPRRIDFDAVDDKLITNLPAQLTGCTVIRSVPNVGTQILKGRTIPVTYEDSIDHCGLIVINRALTPSETSSITSEFNKRAGV